VVFAAPDVAANEFDHQFAGEIAAFSRHLMAYVSSNDQALLLSQWVNRGKRLGRVPVAQPVQPRSSPEGERQFEEAVELLSLQAEGSRNLAVVDATPVNKTRNMHHYFTDSPEFFDDLYRQLLQPDDTVSRRLYAVRVEDRATFWILWDQ
jgi:esterase/lipase superfamily enzyme